MVKRFVVHGDSGSGPAVVGAAMTGQPVRTSVSEPVSDNPSDAPAFIAAGPGAAPLSVDVASYTGTVYVNPVGGVVQTSSTIVWNPTP